VVKVLVQVVQVVSVLNFSNRRDDMATAFRDFSRGAGGRRGTATLGGGSTSSTTSKSSSIDIDATGLLDFFKQRDQDKADRNFLKKNAEDFGFTPDEIDDFSREDLRSLKSGLLKESVGAGVQGEAGDIFRDLINQVPQDQQGESEVLQAIFGEEALPGTQVDERAPTEGIREMNVLGLGGEQTDPRFPVQPGLSEQEFNLNAITPSPIIESGLSPSIPIDSVQPQDFGKFVDESTDPSQSPMQQLQDALVQMNPRDAFRVQSQPFFKALLEMAKQRPQTSQLVQDAEGSIWNVTFDGEGRVKEQRKLNIKKAPSTLKSTVKVLQVQKEDGSLGMDAVTFDSTGKLTQQESIPGAVPKTFKIDVRSLTKGTRTQLEKRSFTLAKNKSELNRLEFEVFGEGGGKEILSALGALKSFGLKKLDKLGLFDTDTFIGKRVAKIEAITGTKLTKEGKRQLQKFTKVQNLAGKIVTAFQKEMTGVAGPIETFDRLAAISVNLSDRGAAGMQATIELARDLINAEQDLISRGIGARDSQEFIAAMTEKVDTSIDALRIKHQGDKEISDAILEAEAEAVSEFRANRGGETGLEEGEISSTLSTLLDSID